MNKIGTAVKTFFDNPEIIKINKLFKHYNKYNLEIKTKKRDGVNKIIIIKNDKIKESELGYILSIIYLHSCSTDMKISNYVYNIYNNDDIGTDDLSKLLKLIIDYNGFTGFIKLYKEYT